QRHHVAFERAAPTVAEPDELMAVDAHALADDGTDDRVEAGAVPAPGQYSDTHPGFLPMGSQSDYGELRVRRNALRHSRCGRQRKQFCPSRYQWSRPKR